jgi:hypothetical protein
MLKFDDDLTVEGGIVTATGPFDSNKEKIIELCAWVFQQDEDRNDRAATEMTEHHEGAHHLLRHKGDEELKFFKDKDGKDHWRLLIAKIGDPPGDMRAGEAFAVAVAMIKDLEKNQQRVIWWGHPVMLKGGA